MTRYDPDHEEVTVMRSIAPTPGLTTYYVAACQGGCVVKSWTKTMDDRNRPNLVETLGELVLEGLRALEEME